MSTLKDIEINHNRLWVEFCKTTINKINVKDSSDLYTFMSNMFLILVKYYKKNKDSYNTIIKFFCKGNNFTNSIKDTLLKFFRNVMKNEYTEKQFKSLFRKFKLKVQRESFMKNLNEKIENLIQNQQCIVHVKTETKEDNKREVALYKIKTDILHQKALQLLRNDLSKRDDTIKHKDDTIKHLQSEILFLRTTMASFNKTLNKSR